MSSLRIKWHKVGAYPFMSYGLVYGKERMHAFCDRRRWSFAAYEACGGCVSTEGTRSLVYVRDGLPYRHTISVVVHEAVHVWQHAVEAAGDEGFTPEVQAYGIQMIAYELIGDLDKYFSRMS